MTLTVKEKRGRFIVGNDKADGQGNDYIASAARSVVEKTTDSQVKAAAGALFGYKITFSGVTAGDKVEIRDSLTAGAGTVIFTIIAVTAGEEHTFMIPQGMEFATGIYHDITLTGGTAYSTYVYV